MRRILFLNVLLCSLLFVQFLHAQTCDLDTFASGFNTECSDKKKPFCIRTDQNPFSAAPTYECVECLTNCDCKMNEFCSQALGSIGTCTKFSLNGKSCFGLTDSQLLNETYPSNWKCAMFYNDFNGTTRINQKGVCVEGKCRYCAWDYSTTSGLSDCGTSDGVGSERICVYPGTQVALQGVEWVPAIYYENPRNVWWAIFFCLLMIVMGMQIFNLYLKCTGKGKKGKRSKSNESTHASEIKLGNSKHNTNNPHTTISPSGPSSTSSNTPPPYEESKSSTSPPAYGS